VIKTLVYAMKEVSANVPHLFVKKLNHKANYNRYTNNW